MTLLFRRDYIERFLKLLLVLVLFLGSFSLVTGEDSNPISNQLLDVEFGEIHQLGITIGEPVKMYQELLIKNMHNQTINSTIILSDYPDKIKDVYLSEYTSISISSDGNIQSAQPVLPVSLAPYNSKEYILEYEFVPVYKDVKCNEETIKSFLPKDALILPSTLPPETVIEKKCSVRIHHEGKIHYYNVEVTLEELENENIKSIYYVEGDEYLTLRDGVISLTK